MSRIGKMPIPIPDGVKIDINDSLVKVTGPKGCIAETMPPEMDLSVVEGNWYRFHRTSHKNPVP